MSLRDGEVARELVGPPRRMSVPRNESGDAPPRFVAPVPPDPTTVTDWILVALVALVVTAFGALSTYLVVRRRRPSNAVLNFKNVPYLVGTMAAGTLNMISVIMANNHFPSHERTIAFSCTFWTVWMQFLFGLTAWIVFMIVRVLIYVFTTTSFELSLRRQNRYIAGTVVVIALPVALVCVVAQLVPEAAYRDPVTHQCHLSWAVDTSILVWIFLCGCAFYGVMRVLRSRSSLNMEEFDDTRAVSPILLVAVLVSFTCALIALSGATDRWWGRFLYALAIVFLHAFTIVAICGEPLYRALRHDRAYRLRFARLIAPADEPQLAILDIAYNHEELRVFLEWCIRQSGDTKWTYRQNLLNVDAAAHCLMRVIERDFPLEGTSSDAVTRRRAADELLAQYVHVGCEHPVVVPEHLRNEILSESDRSRDDLFVRLRTWLIRAFENRFWERYVRTYDRAVLRQRLLRQQRMQERGMMNPQTIVVLSDGEQDDGTTTDSQSEFYNVNLNAASGDDVSVDRAQPHRRGGIHVSRRRDGRIERAVLTDARHQTRSVDAVTGLTDIEQDMSDVDAPMSTVIVRRSEHSDVDDFVGQST